MSSYYTDAMKARATCLNTSKRLTVIAFRLRCIGMNDEAHEIDIMSLRLNSYGIRARDLGESLRKQR